MNLTKHNTLDITDWKQTGAALAKAISEAVQHSQSVLIQAYPDELRLTQKQYTMLEGRNELMSQDMAGQQFHLYRTKYNVMEIKII